MERPEPLSLEPLLPPDLQDGVRRLEAREGRPVRVRLVRLPEGDTSCRIADRGAFLEIRCHDPRPGYFWHLDALRDLLRREGALDQ